MYDTPIAVDLALVYRAQRKALEILCAVDDVCKKHDIKYCLYHGTLLAAVKYHKFIPWDDDCDIFMMREDFEKFLQYSHELPSNLFVQTRKTDLHYKGRMRKVRMNGTKLIGLTEKDNEKYHQGIFVDIFVGDYYPVWAVPIIKLFSWAPTLKQKRKRFPRGSFKRALYGALIAPIYFVHDILEKLWLLAIVPLFRKNKKYKTIGEEAVINAGAFYDVNDWYPTINGIIFEGENFPVPNKYDKLLKKLYGDNYLTYEPRPEERHWHARKILID